VVKFPKAARFVLRSALQRGVTLTVNVVKRGKAVDERRIARQLKANTKLANRRLRYKGPQAR